MEVNNAKNPETRINTGFFGPPKFRKNLRGRKSCKNGPKTTIFTQFFRKKNLRMWKFLSQKLAYVEVFHKNLFKNLRMWKLITLKIASVQVFKLRTCVRASFLTESQHETCVCGSFLYVFTRNYPKFTSTKTQIYSNFPTQ